MTLTSLTGLLNITFLLRSNFQLGQDDSQSSIANTASGGVSLVDMGYVVAGVNVIVPLFTTSLIHRIGQKMFLLVSSGLMAASLLFLTLLSHFQDNNLMHFMNKSPGKTLKEISKKFKIYVNIIIAGFGWTVQTAIVAFLSGHQLGAGPLSWLLNVELIPCKVLGMGTDRWFDSLIGILFFYFLGTGG